MNTPQSIVVDSSVAIAVVRDEPSAAAIRVALDRWSIEGRPLLVPPVFWLEVVNILGRKYRYAGLDVLHAIHELDEFTITTVELDRTQVLVAMDLVERFGVTAYDASYLALAQLHGCDIATLDVELARAAGNRAIVLDARRRLSESPAPYEHDVTWPSYKGASAYLAKLRTEARETARPS
jgi:predicted nucleic acid-binding protein